MTERNEKISLICQNVTVRIALVDQRTTKIKTGVIVSLLGVTLIVSAGISWPPHAFAQDAFEKVFALAEEDCKKIAERFGEQVPVDLTIGGVKIDTYSAGCGFSHANEGVEYDAQQIEDIKIFIGGFDFSRYYTSQAAQQSIRRSINASGLERKTHTIETSDGSLYLLKSPLVYGSEFQKTHTASIDIVKGNCVVGVTSYSQYHDGEYRDEGYHLSTGNRHPGFNHDREADMLKLARQKAEEVFGVLDCADTTVGTPLGENASSVSLTPIDWPKCFAECPVVTASKYCIITPDTRPSGTQCLEDLLRESLACQNTCIAKMLEKECSVDAPPMQFPEINFGDRPYFVSDHGLINSLVFPEMDVGVTNRTNEIIGESENDSLYDELERPPLSSSHGDYVKKLVINAGAREMDFTQSFVDLNFPDLKDTNDKTFADPTNASVRQTPEEGNSSASGNLDTPKQTGILLGEGARAFSLKGDVDILIPGETEWRELKRDDLIPAGSRVFTGMDSDLLISFPKYGAVKVAAFSDFILDQALVDESCKEGSRTPLLHHLDLRTGDVEVIVESNWNYQGSLQVTTPSATNAVRGTHFWVSYDAAKNISATGVYEGTVAVTDRATGATMELKPRSDGTPGIAILGSATTEQPEQTKKGNDLLWVIALLVICGGAFWRWFHKKGKKVDNEEANKRG